MSMAILDKQLEAGIHGDFDKGWLIAQQLNVLLLTVDGICCVRVNC